MSISRRDAITGAAAAAVITGATVAPLAIKAALANDAQIEALYAGWRGAEATWLKANEVADNAHLDALRACGDGPDRAAAYKAAVERYGYNELRRKADVACAAESDALHRFIEAPAEGPRGVLIKIKAFIEEIQVVGTDNRMLETIRNDLERLAGGLAS